jgi:hypothetical protein
VPYLPIPVDLVRLVVACLWVLLIMSVIGLIVSPEFRRETFRRIIRYTLFFLIVYGLIQVFQKALPFAEEVAQEVGGSVLPEEIATEPFPSPPDFVVNPPSWFVTGVSIALIALVLVSIWFTWRRLARIKLTAETPLELLAQEAELALQGLQAGSDLKDTIMRCYFEMSWILKKERGLQRQQAMTPDETAPARFPGFDSVGGDAVIAFFYRSRARSRRHSLAVCGLDWPFSR